MRPMQGAVRIDFELLARSGGLERLRLPEFLGIGMPQGGTGWLHRILDGHPQVFVPRRKELHFWDRQPHRGVRHYSRWFAAAAPGVKVGEVTPAYAALPIERVRRIHRALPGVRAIYIVRNPIERDWSAARRQLGRRLGTNDLSGITDSDWDEVFDRRSMPTRAATASANIERWLEVIDRDQLLVVNFDDVGSAAVAVARSVFGHIGVDTDHRPDPDLLGRKVNSNPEAPMPRSVRARLIDAYAGEIDRMASILERDLRHWLDPGSPPDVGR
ncbi:MAG: sulfotransferase [Actinomycetota bacterium]